MGAALVIELLKLAISFGLDFAREQQMTDEQIKAYRDKIDDIFMKLPSASELPPPPE
jgi:hypothetical protein